VIRKQRRTQQSAIGKDGFGRRERGFVDDRFDDFLRLRLGTRESLDELRYGDGGRIAGSPARARQKPTTNASLIGDRGGLMRGRCES